MENRKPNIFLTTMNIPAELIEAAKRDLIEMKKKAELAKLSDADLELLRRYPNHTLAAARLIDSEETKTNFPTNTRP